MFLSSVNASSLRDVDKTQNLNRVRDSPLNKVALIRGDAVLREELKRPGLLVESLDHLDPLRLQYGVLGEPEDLASLDEVPTDDGDLAPFDPREGEVGVDQGLPLGHGDVPGDGQDLQGILEGEENPVGVSYRVLLGEALAVPEPRPLQEAYSGDDEPRRDPLLGRDFPEAAEEVASRFNPCDYDPAGPPGSDDVSLGHINHGGRVPGSIKR